MNKIKLPQPASSLFADFLDTHKESILDRWRVGVRSDGRIASSEELDSGALLDHLPDILTDISNLLRGKQFKKHFKALEGDSETHGNERWMQGYSLEEVLLEIDRFRKVLVVDLLWNFSAEDSHNDASTIRALTDVLFEFLHELIAGSVTEFTKSKDAQLQAANDEITATNLELDKANANLLVEQEKAHQLSLIDPLTAVANRRQLQNRLSEEIDRTKRYGNPLVVVMVDLDNFKNINDSCGHEVGDRVLKQVASYLKRHCRSSDLIARYGGEEFAMLLPSTALSAAKPLVERIRRSLAEFRIEPLDAPVTGSFGLAQWAMGDNIEQVLSRADIAMYRAKAQGRNRVEVEY